MDCKVENEKLKEELSILHDKLKATELEADPSEVKAAQITQLEQELIALRGENQELKNIQAKNLEVIQDLEQKKADILKELAEAQIQRQLQESGSPSEAQSHLEKLVKDLSAENEQIAKQYQDLNQQAQKSQQQAKNARNEMQAQIEALQQQTQDLQQQA